MKKYIFESERLGFRLFNETDKVPFFEMNSNGEVMKYFKKILSREESDDFINRIELHFQEYGYGLWAVEEKESHNFIGFIGLFNASFEADFTPCIEIGWRLDNKYWYKGYATEGAKACLDYAFNKLGLNEIYSFTSVINLPSINVMEKIGLRIVKTFEHPRLEEGNPLRPHVLYKKVNERRL